MGDCPIVAQREEVEIAMATRRLYVLVATVSLAFSALKYAMCLMDVRVLLNLRYGRQVVSAVMRRML